MHPVLHHNRRESFVPIAAAGTIDSERTGYAVGVLSLVVAMVPSVSVLLSCEVVGECLIVCNRALSDAIDTVVRVVV